MRVDKESPRYFVRHWRNIPQETEQALEEFLDWLEHDGESPEISQETLDDIKALVNMYLGRDLEKIEQGEQELLDEWIKACQQNTV